MTTTCTYTKEMNHAAQPDCLCPSRVGGTLLIEAVLATAVTLSAPASTTHRIVEAAAQSPMPKFSACVLARESGGTLDDPTSGVRARNPHSSASGRWQFLDTSWRINGGLHWMVGDRLRDFGMPAKQAKAIRVDLARKPIHTWPGRLQDVAHAAVLQSPNGWRHWRNGDRCDRLAVTR